MAAVPQNIISNLTEIILNHIRQTSQELQGVPNLDTDYQTQLQAIEKQIDALENTLEGVQTSLNTRIARRRKHRNSLTRFNQLPLEIASHILWLSIADPWPGMNSYLFLHRQQTISRVCSSWRNLVKDSPRFWSILEFEWPPTAISRLLEKSQSSALEINSGRNSEYTSSPINRFEHAQWTYFGLILPHTDRIRSLILSFYCPSGLGMVFEQPAPMLEELKLDSVDSYVAQGFDLFCGQASRLRDVALRNIAVEWNSSVLVGLRSLSIVEQLQYLPTEGQVQRLLEANPGLEKLDIGGLTMVERFGNDAVQSPGEVKPGRVVMSRMRELRLSKLPFELVRAVLGNVEIPSIIDLELSCLFGGLPASRLDPNFKDLVPVLIQRSRDTQQVELTVGRSSVGLAIFTPPHNSPTIQIEFKETMPISGFDRLIESFFHVEGLPSVCAAEIFQVSLKFDDGFDLGGGSFIPILDQLSMVKVGALTIEDWSEHVEELLKYLGEAKEDSQWPLPYLTSFKIVGPAELGHHLLVALQRRKQYTPAGETPAAPRPAMLEVLDIGGLRGIDEDVEKALAECVASGGTFIPGRRQLLHRDIFGGSDSELSDI